MRVIEDAWERSSRTSGPLSSGSVATIGNFDGIHLGQRAVLSRVRERARASGLDSVVVTFEPHPRTVLRPGSGPELLTTRAQKRDLLEREGIDLLAVVRFDEAFAETSADDFVRRLLHRGLEVRELFVGSGFGFGKGREGNVELLRTRGRELGFVVAGVPELEFEGRPVSSTRIREAIRRGRTDSAQAMLGRPYTITGRVERGLGRGRRMGWRTINLEPLNELLPGNGVYASTVRVGGGAEVLGGVTNVGVRPTFPEDAAGGLGRFVECHLLDVELGLYDETVELSFLAKLREERAFPSADELSRQIGEDVERARQILREYSAAQKRYQVRPGEED